MKVVVDTNVLVSAALKDKDPEIVLLWIVARPGCDWLVTREILDEYMAVLARPKFGLPEDLQREWRTLLNTATTLIPTDLAPTFLRDPSDAKFLACALTGGADFFITGDRDFEAAEKLLTTRIVSIALFKRLVCDIE